MSRDSKQQDTCKHGQAEEEIFASSDGGSKEDNKLDRILCTLQNILQCDTDFSLWRESFFKQNCKIFDCRDENKLEYTTIHNTYMSEFEHRVESQLKKNVIDFSMSDFLQLVEKHKEEVSPEILDTLETVNDFHEFKNTMLAHKNPIDMGFGSCISGIGLSIKDSNSNRKQRKPEKSLERLRISSKIENIEGRQTCFNFARKSK